MKHLRYLLSFLGLAYCIRCCWASGSFCMVGSLQIACLRDQHPYDCCVALTRPSVAKNSHNFSETTTWLCGLAHDSLDRWWVPGQVWIRHSRIFAFLHSRADPRLACTWSTFGQQIGRNCLPNVQSTAETKPFLIIEVCHRCHRCSSTQWIVGTQVNTAAAYLGWIWLIAFTDPWSGVGAVELILWYLFDAFDAFSSAHSYRIHLFSCHAAGAEPHHFRICTGLGCSLTTLLQELWNLDPEVGALVAACLTMVEHQRVRQDSNQQPKISIFHSELVFVCLDGSLACSSCTQWKLRA